MVTSIEKVIKRSACLQALKVWPQISLCECEWTQTCALRVRADWRHGSDKGRIAKIDFRAELSMLQGCHRSAIGYRLLTYRNASAVAATIALAATTATCSPSHYGPRVYSTREPMKSGEPWDPFLGRVIQTSRECSGKFVWNCCENLLRMAFKGATSY